MTNIIAFPRQYHPTGPDQIFIREHMDLSTIERSVWVPDLLDLQDQGIISTEVFHATLEHMNGLQRHFRSEWDKATGYGI